MKMGFLRKNMLRWMGVPVDLLNNEWLRDLADAQGRLSSSGITVTTGKALTLSTVWACAGLIADSIGMLPLHIYRRRGQARDRNDVHPLAKLFAVSPDGRLTAAEFLAMFVLSLLLRGNTYCRVDRDGYFVRRIEFLPPDRVSARYNQQTGRLDYKRMLPDGRWVEVPHDEMWHTRGLSLDGLVGMSVIEYGVNSIGGALSADTQSNETFRNGMLNRFFYKYDKAVREDQRTQFQDNLRKQTDMMHAGRAPLLELGLDIKTINIAPKDAQLLESRSYNVEDVCRWFRVPPHMVGHTSKATSWGSGIESQQLGFLQFTMLPWLTRIEQSANLFFNLHANNSFSRFKIESFARADMRTRGWFYATGLQNGYLNRNEVRGFEEMDDIPGGDEYTVQTNMTLLSMLEQVVDSNMSQRQIGQQNQPGEDTDDVQ